MSQPGKQPSAAHARRGQPTRPQGLSGLLASIKMVWKRFTEDQGPVLAAGLTFFTLLSIVPMMLVALAVLGFVMNSPHDALLKMQQSVGQLLPGPAGADAFRQLAEQINLEKTLAGVMNARGVALYTGVLSLVWAALQIFVNATTQMNAAFNATESRSWIKLRLVALGVLVAAAALFLLSLVPTSGPDFVRNLHIPWLNLPEAVPAWVDILFSLVAVAINVAMFAVIYRFLPAARVTWREALFAGVVVGVLWEIAKKGFALYLAQSDGYGAMYGAMGGVILLITWMYYTNFILLLGAEVGSVYRDTHRNVALPNAETIERDTLHAVYEGRAVPLTAGPRGQYEGTERTPEEAKERAAERVRAMREDIRDAGAAVRRATREIRGH